jgi:hypothetical protein
VGHKGTLRERVAPDLETRASTAFHFAFEMTSKLKFASAANVFAMSEITGTSCRTRTSDSRDTG